MAGPLRIAVVGVGVHGTRYAEHLLRGDVPGAVLAGVSRRDPAAAASWTARGVRFERDGPALAASPDVDAVVIASPPAAHRTAAETAFARGKPVLLEKPLAPNEADVRAIQVLAEQAGVPVLIGHSLRYNGVARAVREALRTMGKLRSVAVSQRHEALPQSWQLSPAEGGALLNSGVHCVDLVRWFSGQELETVAGVLRSGGPGRAETAAAVVGTLSGGASFHIDVDVEAPGRWGRIEACCEDGQLLGDYYTHHLDRIEGPARVPLAVEPPGPGLVPLLREFVREITTGERGDAARLEDGVASALGALAARDAAQARAVRRVPGA